MKLKTALASAALASSILATQVHAGVVGTIPGGAKPNDFITTFSLGDIEGWYGSNLYLSGAGTISVEIFGYEAGYANSFAAGGDSYTKSGQSGFAASLTSGAALDSWTYAAPAGLLDFTFGTGGHGFAVNGANVLPETGSPNFFVTFDNGYTFDTTVDGSTAWYGTSVFLFLDDGGSGPDDDNHDDLVVRLSVTGGNFHVPEPASLALLGLGLVGIGAARRRRNKA